MSADIKIDISNALRKTQVVLMLIRAAQKQAWTWASDTLRTLKFSAKCLKKSGRGTGFLSNNVGMDVAKDGSEILLGTGVKTQSVPYANIQDKGGDIVPVNAQYLTIPFPGVQGRAKNFKDAFVIKLKTGNLALVQSDGNGGIIPLFTLVKRVHLQRTGWFSDILALALLSLREKMGESAVYARAETLAAGKSSKGKS